MDDRFYTFLASKGTWMLKLLLPILFALLVNSLFKRFYHKLFPKKSNHFVREAFLISLSSPFRLFIWVISLFFLANWLNENIQSALLNTTIFYVRTLVIFLIVVWACMRFISQMEIAFIEEKIRSKKPYDKTTVRAVCQMIRTSLLLLLFLVALQSFGVSLSAVLAFGGTGALIAGFAAKDLLSNFFGGLMIYLDRPFAVGDLVCSPDKNIEGCVEHIGWRLTRIRTFERKPLYVPNALFSNISVQNSSRITHRRMKTTVGIRYSDASKMADLLKSVEAMLHNHKEVDQEKLVMVNFTEFGASSLNFTIYAFIKRTDLKSFNMAQQDIFLKVIDLINQHGAACAFPTSTLDLPSPVPVQMHS